PYPALRTPAPTLFPYTTLFRSEPLTMLFLGSWRHDPNRVAVDWFMKHVMPRILAEEPAAKLIIVGSDPPPEHTYADHAAHMTMRSEEHTSELSHLGISYAVFCL